VLDGAEGALTPEDGAVLIQRRIAATGALS
jgi:hypothetical protein